MLTYGQTPPISTEDWEFRVWGLAHVKTFSWSDFVAMPQHDFTDDFHYRRGEPWAEERYSL